MNASLLTCLSVALRPHKPGAPVFEVFRGRDGWHYHQRRGGKITSSSEAYASKWNAKRAAYAQAAQTDGAVVRVLPPV